MPNLIAVATSNFVYFYTFHGLKHLWPSHDQNSQRDSLLAYIAGSVNVLLTTPLWVSSVRVKLQKQGYLKKKDDDDKETVYYNGLLGKKCERIFDYVFQENILLPSSLTSLAPIMYFSASMLSYLLAMGKSFP